MINSFRNRCWEHALGSQLGWLDEVGKAHQSTVGGAFNGAGRGREATPKPALPPTAADPYREALLTFYDFPADHWDHLRTSNPIESVFATVRHRTVRTKGALSQKTAKLMVFTLVQAAAKKWRRLKGANQLPLVVEGIIFNDGVASRDADKSRAA